MEGLEASGEEETAPKLEPLLCSAPPTHTIHMVPSNQIWGFLHEIIRSQEALTGLSRQFQGTLAMSG